MVAIVVEKLASLPNAAANSFNVSNAAGALATKFEISVLTNCVVASWVVFVPLVAVGAVGVPVSAADDNGAYVFCICVLLKKLVLILESITDFVYTLTKLAST